jgi:acylphosphatase
MESGGLYRRAGRFARFFGNPGFSALQGRFSGIELRKMALEARHLWFSGTVQGVGFRYTAQRIASRCGLVGWVRNLDDGRVEMVVQGDAKDIEKCVNGIMETFGSYVRDVESADSSVNSSYRSFEITF